MLPWGAGDKGSTNNFTVTECQNNDFQPGIDLAVTTALQDSLLPLTSTEEMNKEKGAAGGSIATSALAAMESTGQQVGLGSPAGRRATAALPKSSSASVQPLGVSGSLREYALYPDRWERYMEEPVWNEDYVRLLDRWGGT
jgi:hypothetical protein